MMIYCAVFFYLLSVFLSLKCEMKEKSDMYQIISTFNLSVKGKEGERWVSLIKLGPYGCLIFDRF